MNMKLRLHTLIIISSCIINLQAALPSSTIATTSTTQEERTTLLPCKNTSITETVTIITTAPTNIAPLSSSQECKIMCVIGGLSIAGFAPVGCIIAGAKVAGITAAAVELTALSAFVAYKEHTAKSKTIITQQPS